MPGIATQFAILERTMDRLAASPDPGVRDALAAAQAQRAYAYLGAVGAAIADFIPSDPPPPDVPSTGGTSPYTTLWRLILAITGGDGTSADPGMYAILKTFRDFLDKIVPAARDEDLDVLSDLNDSGELDAVVQMASTLEVLVSGFTSRVLDIGSAITAGMKPGVNVSPGSAVPAPVAWTAREFLHWKHPGRFATALARRARESGDQRFIAYSVGYLCSFAGSVAGSPFANSIVGGAYRPQWWRHRWINNYIDAWVYGAYRTSATMAGDTPTPPYDQWPGLCSASLHSRIELAQMDAVDIMKRLREGSAFPAVLPDDFAAYWMTAWRDAYGDQFSRFSAGALNGAYVMTWMMLWFQTSGEVIGCNPPPPMVPPAGCDGTQPAWVDPFTQPAGSNGAGAVPPQPTFEHDPDVAEIVTGIILALLGAASLFFGGGAAGIAAIAGGVALIVDGALTFTWDELRCDLYWYQHYLYNGVQVLHNLVTLGGFTHPYPAELALDTTTMSLLGSPYSFDSGVRVVRSRPRVAEGAALAAGHEGYPSRPWSGMLGTWPNAPTGSSPGWEDPPTTAYYTQAYPTFFVDDDAANPLTPNGDVKTSGSWPPGFRVKPGGTGPVQFGNAVANAADLVAHWGDDLPDWNLDADRGMASLTWQFSGGVYSDPVQAEPEPG